MPIKILARIGEAFGRRAARWRDESGSVIVIVAILFPILIGAAGFGMDYAYVAYIKQRLDRAAEAAVVAAVSQSLANNMGGYQNTNGLAINGKGVFNANISQLSIGAMTATLNVVPNGSNGAIATINYSTTVPALFSSIVGINTFALSGNASAKASGTTYINYYIVVDISQSMGIGATQTDMSNLFARTTSYGNGGCVFGCHVTQSGQSRSNEDLAHNVSPPITLRIDSARAAVQDVITAAQQSAGTQKNIKIGIYTMSKDPVTGLSFNTLSAPSNNYAALSGAANLIDLGNNTSAGIGDSDFSGQMTQFNAVVPANGTGVTAASPLNYVFIVTDGMGDVAGSCTSGHCTSAFSSSYCTPLKSKATVGAIYTTYLPIYNNNDSSQGYQINYSQLALPYVNQLAPNLQSCATSGNYYFEASDGPSITAAMQKLFASTLNAPVLTH